MFVSYHSDPNADIRVKWFQCYYDIISEINKFEFTQGIYCEFGNPFFENQAILQIYQKQLYADCDYLSIISTKDKFIYKTGYDIETVMRKMSQDNCDNKIYFFGKHNLSNVWILGDGHHGSEFSVIARAIFNKIGIKKDITKLETYGIYSNFWVASKKIFVKYCEEILIPIYLLMKNDEEIKRLVEREIKYESSAKRKDIIYTYHTFILERCFTTFLSLYKIKAKQI